ncbi:MAG TPA: hypothetical protein VHI10_19000 [Mycobacterium sp.]|nr:hypothetical protein [Mycobacterium sp.]
MAIDIKTKQITLTWTLLPFQQATLTVTESPSGTTVIDEPVGLFWNTGTVPLTVTLGSTYTAQLTDNVTNRPLGAPLTITTKRSELSAPIDPCNLYQCITSVNVQPHGGWAQFTIKTNKLAPMKLEASTTPPNADGTWSSPDAVAASAGTIFPADNWTPPLANLNPNTTYYYVVRAYGNGPAQVKTGSFKTLTRRVDVKFAEIEMIDDSDGFGAGDCDCFYFFGVGDEVKEWGSLGHPKSIGSGTPPVHPNVTFAVTNAPSEIWLRAKGYDDDADFGEFCSVGIGPEPWQDSGSGQECLEWAGNQVKVSLSRQGPTNAPGNVDEQFTEPFTISVNGELRYKVRGTYKVTYVP